VVAVSSFLIAITTVVVSLRMIARYVKGIRYGWDDLFRRRRAGALGCVVAFVRSMLTGIQIFTILMCVINIICQSK
jgi:hypothetical protein